MLSASSGLTDQDALYEEAMQLCGSINSYQDSCYATIAVHARGEEAASACFQIPIEKYLTRVNCLEEVAERSR